MCPGPSMSVYGMSRGPMFCISLITHCSFRWILLSVILLWVLRSLGALLWTAGSSAPHVHAMQSRHLGTPHPAHLEVWPRLGELVPQILHGNLCLACIIPRIRSSPFGAMFVISGRGRMFGSCCTHSPGPSLSALLHGFAPFPHGGQFPHQLRLQSRQWQVPCPTGSLHM